jgi:SAM-dependent methyltransferase
MKNTLFLDMKLRELKNTDAFFKLQSEQKKSIVGEGLSFDLDKFTDGNLTKLNLGCSTDIKCGWTNVDNTDDYRVIKHDLNKFPYPFKNKTFDLIYLSHVLEHLNNPLKVINELHRILKDNGTLIVRVPHYSGNSAWIDITHKRPYSYATLKQLDNVEYCKLYNAKQFSKVTVQFGFWLKWYYPWNYIIEPLANLQPIYYEHSFANIFPPFEVITIMKK